jgi:serine/threonine protein kinase
MIIKLIFLKYAGCLLRQANQLFLEKRGMFQSKMHFDYFEPAPITLTDTITAPGYIKGYPFTDNQKVFKCQNNLTKIVYICKSPYVPKDEYTLPMEIQVFQKLKNNPHKSLIQMHEVFSLGLIESRMVYVEVIQYFSPENNWINLSEYLNGSKSEVSLLIANHIFEQVLNAVIHLYTLDISHGDIKRNLILIF